MKYVLLSIFMILSAICFFVEPASRVMFKKDPSLFVQELGEPIMTSIESLIDPSASTIETYDFEILYNKDDLINHSYLKVGIYDAKIYFRNVEVPFQITIQDTTSPTLSLKKKTMTLKAGETISNDDLCNLVIVNDLSETKEINIISNVDFKQAGKYQVVFEVEDIYGNKSKQETLEVIIEALPINENNIVIEELIINEQTAPLENVCANGQTKINPSRNCDEPAYDDDYPDMIGDIDDLRAYATENKLSHFITNITLNDGTETYGLWITDE